VGQPLDARQAALVARHNELEAANNAIARKEAASSGGTFKVTRPHMIPSDLYKIEGIRDARERAHASRELKAKWRDDPNSDYNNVKSPEHKNAISAMQRLYVAESELPQPEDEK
jgi:hypothetical protein